MDFFGIKKIGDPSQEMGNREGENQEWAMGSRDCTALFPITDSPIPDAF
jgi:hypothetical protein